MRVKQGNNSVWLVIFVISNIITWGAMGVWNYGVHKEHVQVQERMKKYEELLPLWAQKIPKNSEIQVGSNKESSVNSMEKEVEITVLPLALWQIEKEHSCETSEVKIQSSTLNTSKVHVGWQCKENIKR